MKRKQYFNKITIDVCLAEKFNELYQDPEENDSYKKLCNEGNNSAKLKEDDEHLGYIRKGSTALTDEFLLEDSDSDLVFIIDNLYISNEATSNNEELLKTNKITHVINLAAKEEQKKFDEVKYFNAILKDTPDGSILNALVEVIKFVKENEHEEESGHFLFGGKKGISRSVSVMAGVIMYKHRLKLDQALAILRKQKPNIDPNIGFLGQLKIFEEQGVFPIASNKTTHVNHSIFCELITYENE